MRSEFTERVYAAARQIPPGRVASYGCLAALAGKPACSAHCGICDAHLPRTSTCSLPPGGQPTAACAQATRNSGSFWPRRASVFFRTAVDMTRFSWP